MSRAKSFTITALLVGSALAAQPTVSSAQAMPPAESGMMASNVEGPHRLSQIRTYDHRVSVTAVEPLC